MKKITQLGILFFMILNYSSTTTANTSIDTDFSTSIRRGTRLPQHLITTYTGVLVDIAGGLMVNLNGSCTIIPTGNGVYKFTFSNGIPPIRGVRFRRDDDTYTVASISGSNASGIVIDDGDLTIGMVQGNSGQTFSFSGSIDDDAYENEDTGYESQPAPIRVGNTQCDTNTTVVYTGNTDHTISYDCNTPGITAIPKQALGIYTGALNCSAYGSAPDGVANLIKVGCNTYRIEFSNGIPAIDYIQFKDDGHGDYIAVRINGDYATGIEVDAKFGDLTIDPKCNYHHIAFDGEQ